MVGEATELGDRGEGSMPGFQEDKARKVHWLGVDGRQQTAVALPVLRPAERERATHLGRAADSCLCRMFHTGGYTSGTKSQKTRQKDPCCPEVTIPWGRVAMALYLLPSMSLARH